MEVKLALRTSDQGSLVTVLVEPIGESRWKLLEVNPLVEKFTYAAELVTREGPDGVHELLEVAESTDFEHWGTMLPTFYKRDKLPEVARDFVAAGGFWQITLGGILSVAIPKGYHKTIDELTASWGIIPSSSGRED
ncbi:hypothetical protein FUA23_21715 [Neolewinella aurantiaca]|uniref:Uncharacterized protein n=1 Tax=Neolewinella aurantiaca TaxID=2602767 RepID=A0A5C7FA85_9BACT|nr:hypothetical protein [Neolewinella aurantiaca]TXF82965.1 hypothetical protein FUA23_21715 [Neolewinella aurantiaca]